MRTAGLWLCVGRLGLAVRDAALQRSRGGVSGGYFPGVIRRSFGAICNYQKGGQDPVRNGWSEAGRKGSHESPRDSNSI